jgi:ribosomal protein S18 acetylase RimI-like enzyme
MFRLKPGRPEDASAAARMIAETDRDLFRYCTGGNLEDWISLSIHEWRHERGIYSYTMADVVRAGAKLLGLVVSYSSQRHWEIAWDLSSSAPHLAPELVERVRQTHRIIPFLFPYIPDDAWYVQNLVVDPESRGTGLGRYLMQSVFEKAVAAGCRSVHLDVDSSVPAVQFYERLGFEMVVETRVPRITAVHPHYRMVLELG